MIIGLDIIIKCKGGLTFGESIICRHLDFLHETFMVIAFYTILLIAYSTFNMHTVMSVYASFISYYLIIAQGTHIKVLAGEVFMQFKTSFIIEIPIAFITMLSLIHI